MGYVGCHKCLCRVLGKRLVRVLVCVASTSLVNLLDESLACAQYCLFVALIGLICRLFSFSLSCLFHVSSHFPFISFSFPFTFPFSYHLFPFSLSHPFAITRLHHVLPSRINRYERERVLSFVPPDGVFELMRFRINTGTNFQMPVYVKPQIHFSGGSAKIDVSCGARHTGGRVVEGMRVHIPLPMSTISVNISVNHGSFEFDPVSKVRS